MKVFLNVCQLILIVLLFVPASAQAQKRVLDKKWHLIRSGKYREWVDFPLQVEDSQLVIHFNLKDTAAYQTVSLRHQDIGREWKAELNGVKLGTLPLDEKDMVSYFAIPSRTLKRGSNILKIAAVTGQAADDDVRIGEIVLYRLPVTKLLAEGSLQISIRDIGSNEFLPSRITLVNEKGALQPVAAETGDSLAVRTGVIYTASGRARFSLPAGRYTLYASRGFEYSADSMVIVVKPGTILHRTLAIRHEVPATGWVSCDPHIHTLTYSGHGDASMKERVITMAGEGVRFPVITEHNRNVDIDTLVKEMKLEPWITPVTGNEVTTPVGHFNVFPADPSKPVVDPHVNDWNALPHHLQETGGHSMVILNHARDIHNGFRPFDTTTFIGPAGQLLYGWDLPANAMEIMNSGSQQTDPGQLYHDWMHLMDRGIFLIPVGSSDSHDVSRFLVGQARTYIKSGFKKGKPIDVKETVGEFAGGKVTVSFGLLTEIAVLERYGPGDLVPGSGKLNVTVRVWAPGWIQADRVSLYANGQKIREARITRNRKGGLQREQTWTIDRPHHDMYLFAVAEGPDPQVPFWPIAKPYQHSMPDLNPMVIGITGAVRIDADKDGCFTSAYAYALSEWEASQKQMDPFLQRLGKYDRNVSVQAASIAAASGIDITGPEVTKALGQAPGKVRAGFQTYIHAWRQAKFTARK